MPALTIGLLADTHLPHRLKQLPKEVLDALAGVDLILHAGDVDDPASLAPLEAIAPVRAVRGNFHVTDLAGGSADLPAAIEMELAGKRIVVTHGHLPGPIGFAIKGVLIAAKGLRLIDNGTINRWMTRRLKRRYPQADVIVFGHSHLAHVTQIEGTLLVNPGAVYVTGKEQPTVARMRLGVDGPEVEIIQLGTCNPRRKT